ncbi:MAG: dephospho-CoA kinase [Thermodesulfovibrionales bacterium]|nr:dephospho-CoA kinase [Thermodesulfovibrionales bacterium]
MIIVALTGNIGMGKSHALGAFAQEGAFTVNSDAVVAELLTRPEVVENVKFILGSGVLNEAGELDKRAVADVIFGDEDLRGAYEGIIHPLVFDRVNELIAASGVDIAVVEVPMLFENGYESQFSRTITIYADENVALDRMDEAGFSRDDAVRRLTCQMPIADKISRSDFTIDNNGAPEDVRPRVHQIYRALVAQGLE